MKKNEIFAIVYTILTIINLIIYVITGRGDFLILGCTFLILLNLEIMKSKLDEDNR